MLGALTKMTHGLLDFPADRQGIDHGVGPKVTLTTETPCRNVVNGHHQCDCAGGAVHSPFEAFLVSAVTELFNRHERLLRR